MVNIVQGCFCLLSLMKLEAGWAELGWVFVRQHLSRWHVRQDAVEDGTAEPFESR